MAIHLYHKPIDPSRPYSAHAWADGSTWISDGPGVRAGELITFVLSPVPDPRKVKFKFRSTSPSGDDEWESDDFVRRIRHRAPTHIWSFEQAARIVYRDPKPAGVAFAPGDVLTFKVITQNRFKGGKIYVWNPYDPTHPTGFFDETSRADPVSTFNVTLAPWMTEGFHFKLFNHDNVDRWEPEWSNRVWTPGDGALLWVKSGQVSVRHTELKLTNAPLEALYPASLMSPPAVDLIDPVDDFRQPLTPAVVSAPGLPLFRIARYDAAIYPDAVYQVAVPAGGAEGWEPIVRPFPADTADDSVVSRFLLGVDGWIADFPTAMPAITMAIEPRPASSFTGGLTVDLGLGIADKYDTVAASLLPDGSWQATLNVVAGAPNWIRLHGAAGDEPKPYDWIDTRKYFAPSTAGGTFFTAEGVYGVTARGPVPFAEPPSRGSLMDAAFGAATVRAGVFAAREMPHGATRSGADVYFVVHAPHAASASLVLIDEAAPGGAARRTIPMSLTGDGFYWWVSVPAYDAPPGTRYRFLLNETLEVMDPAAREVFDGGSFQTAPDDDPNDSRKSWSLVLDVDAVRSAAHAAPWQTMGWEALLIYEIHPRRFTDIAAGSLAPLDLLADEFAPVSRVGRPGYLRELPVTALELLPVHEFPSDVSWGYNPAFFFAIDSSYGGSAALARLVSEAHTSGCAVLLDVVYNHMSDSPLTRIARDVYRNGEAWGDRINSGHPMVIEFFRQAMVYQGRTFGLDGYRFDDTKTIIGNTGGWGFLSAMRSAVRAGANAEGRRWPYFVAENEPTGDNDKKWNVTDSRWSVMDGMWALDEAYRLRDCSYDSWQPSDDHVNKLKQEMDAPGVPSPRPYFEAVRYAESHDMVSAQDAGNKRVAARPPYRQGFQMAKAIGTIPLLARGVPILFMGEEVAETRAFSFDNTGIVTNPQQHDLAPAAATDNTRVLAWFRALMRLRNDPSKGLRGDATYQVASTGRRTVAFTCGVWQSLFVVVTFGTEDQRQDSGWLGLPGGATFKEIFNSSWPAFQVEFEAEHTNGGYDAQIQSGQILNLPFIGAVVLERR
jgi:1,4-alpha-glucan branching enzyme